MESTHDESAEDGRGERRVLVVDDEPNARNALTALLREEGYAVRAAPDGYKALGLLKEWPCDVLLTDLRMPLLDGISLMQKAKVERPELVCIVMTAFSSVDSAVEAMKAGAEDYLTKPLNFDAVQLVLERAFGRLGMRRELETLRAQRKQRDKTRLIGNSAPMQQVVKMIDQVASARASVLITGESGTGKELIARLLHEKSNRAAHPFIRLHCAALAESLLESELFGHEKGAFTGAMGRRKGRFEEADGGTLFLDEIGEISPNIQVKLLRFLQEREFERVGGNQTISVDVRVVAATNRDLQEEVRAGRFREDLYYRLNVINVLSPPLRTRRSDIPVLAQHFVARFAAENAKVIHEITPEALERIQGWDWPGNVRELENVIERAVVLCDGQRIELRHLPDELRGGQAFVGGDIRIPGSTLEDIERFAILKTYESTGGSTQDTARILNISPRKIQYKLKEYKQ